MRTKLLLLAAIGLWGAHDLLPAPAPEEEPAVSAAPPEGAWSARVQGWLASWGGGDESPEAADPVILCVFPGDEGADSFLRRSACGARGGRPEHEPDWARAQPRISSR